MGAPVLVVVEVEVEATGLPDAVESVFRTNLLPLESATKTTPPMVTSLGGGGGGAASSLVVSVVASGVGGSEDRSCGVVVPLLEVEARG